MNKKTLYTSLAALALLSFQAKGFADENTSTSSWVAAQLSGGFPIYADRAILTNATTGEVLYDGSTDGMSDWSDLLARLGLPTDLHVGGRGADIIDNQLVYFGSIELPKANDTKNVTTGKETETISSAKESEVKQNRTEKTSAEQEVKSEKALLPSTGEVMSVLGVIGAGLSSLGLIGLKRRRK